MKKVSSVQFVVRDVRFTTVANIVHEVASRRNVYTSGPTLSCVMSRRTSAPSPRLQRALAFRSSSLHLGWRL